MNDQSPQRRKWLAISKFALIAACLVCLYRVVWGNGPEDAITTLHLPVRGVKPIFERQFASLNSDLIYLKLVMPKQKSEQLLAWFQQCPRSEIFSPGSSPDMPPLVDGDEPNWTPKEAPASAKGDFLINDISTWDCRYLITSKSKTEDVIYIYAIAAYDGIPPTPSSTTNSYGKSP